MTYDLTPLINYTTELGECPLWSSAEKVLYFVDIKQKHIHRFHPQTALLDTMTLPEEVGCIGLVQNGGFIAGLRSGIWLLSQEGIPLKKLANNPENQQISRFNDGCVDPHGRFIAGTVDEEKKDPSGKAHLYIYDKNGLKMVADKLLTSNGVAFSPDGAFLYHADTPRYTVYRYDYNAKLGQASNRQIFVQKDSNLDKGRPDGGAVDVEGCYWTALYEGGRIQRYAPDGKLLEEYTVPAKCPTMIAFGGEDMKTLFCTSAKIGRPKEELEHYPLSGALFSMRLKVAGLERPLFNPD